MKLSQEFKGSWTHSLRHPLMASVQSALQGLQDQGIHLGQSKNLEIKTELKQNILEIEIPEGTLVPEPLCILHSFPEKNLLEGLPFTPKVQIRLGPKSHLTLIEIFSTPPSTPDDPSHSSNDSRKTPAAEVAPITFSFLSGDIGSGSKLTYCRVQDEFDSAIHWGSNHFSLETGSLLNLLNLHLGSQWSRYHSTISLLGAGAEAKLRGLGLAKPGQQLEDHTFIDHLVGETQSSQLQKNLIAEGGKAIFEGLVHIYPNAQKTQASQLSKSLLLGKKAFSFSQPQLEIQSDDVKATHGSTVSQLNEEEIFYCLSRGIPRTESLKMMSLGFLSDLLEDADLSIDSELHDYLFSFLKKHYARLETMNDHTQINARTGMRTKYE